MSDLKYKSIESLRREQKSTERSLRGHKERLDWINTYLERRVNNKTAEVPALGAKYVGRGALGLQHPRNVIVLEVRRNLENLLQVHYTNPCGIDTRELCDFHANYKKVESVGIRSNDVQKVYDEVTEARARLNSELLKFKKLEDGDFYDFKDLAKAVDKAFRPYNHALAYSQTDPRLTSSTKRLWKLMSKAKLILCEIDFYKSLESFFVLRDVDTGLLYSAEEGFISYSAEEALQIPDYDLTLGEIKNNKLSNCEIVKVYKQG